MTGIDDRGRRDRAAEALFSGPGEVRARCRAVDWAATPLGPVTAWPAALRFAVRLCLDNVRPMCVFGGIELVHIYNDSYAAAVGAARHPHALGRPAREVWSDLWEQIEHEYEQVMSGGAAIERNADLRFVVDRGNGPEATCWNYAISPIRDDDGLIVGCYTLINDTTERTWAALERARAEAALRDSEARYRTLFERMGQGYCDLQLIREADGNVVDLLYLKFNPAFERIFGIGVAAAEGRKASEVFPDLEPWWRETYDRISRSGMPERIEHEVRSLGRWFEVYVYPRDADRLTLLFGDITIRKNAEQALRESEETQAFLLRLSDALGPIGDAQAITREALDVLRRHLGMPRAVYAEAVDQDGTMRVVAESVTAGLAAMEGLTFRLADFAPGALAEALERRPLWREDVLGDEHTTLGARAWVMVPLVKSGHLVASLTVHSAEARTWTSAEVALIQETAERTWAAVQRALAEAAIRASEEQFRRSIEEAPIPVIMHAENGEVLQISRTWSDLTGYTISDVPTFDAWLTRAYGFGADDVRQHMHALFAGRKRTMSIEFPVRTRAGEMRHWSFSASAPGTLHDGRRFVVGMALDVTERKRAEEALRASQERYRTLFETMGQAYALCEVVRNETGQVVDVRLLEVNPAYERLFGLSAEKARGRRGDELFPNVDPWWIENYQRVVSAGRPERLEYKFTEIERWFEAWVYPREGDQFVVLFDDITERKHAEEVLRQSHDVLEARVRERTEEVQALFRRLVSAQEEERRRIARDIHDQLGQQMTALRMSIDALSARSAADPAAAQIANRSQRLAEELDQSIDFLAWQLRPAALDRLGLPAALAHLVSGWSDRFGIPADHDSFDAEGVRLSPEAESNLYLLTQEALHNVVKHARATYVSVVLAKRDGRLMIVIEDNGIGFDVPDQGALAVGALGLISMRERATLVGAEFTIESAPGRGTTIVVNVPMEASSS